MFNTRKLRADTSIIGIGQPIIALLIFAVIWSFAGITMGLVFMAFVYLFYALLSLLSLVRMGNPWYMATLIFQLTIILFALTAPEIGLYPSNKENFKPLMLILFIEFAVLAYIMATGKLKWRGREILELAAMNINETNNGFTERPKPLGKIDAGPGDIAGFCNYLKSHLIAVSFVESSQTVIVPIMMGNEYKLPLGLSSDYSKYTRIIIDNENNVSAVISKKDYLKYKEALSFDLLSESLGKLFIIFFEYYQRGEEVRIMHEISKLKMGPFS
jgi:hypothetical protein